MGFFDSLFRNKSGQAAAMKGFERTSEHDFMNYAGRDEEYAAETYTDFNNNDFINSYSAYSGNGIQLKQATNMLRLLYNGILAKSGAQDVFAVIGRGSNENWSDVKYYPMSSAGNQYFEVLFPASDTGSINIAFKDGADHWDNNSGMNYVIYNKDTGSH